MHLNKNLFVRWKNNWKAILRDSFACIGGIETTISLFSFFKIIPEHISYSIKLIFLPLVVITICSLKNKPKTSFQYKLRNKDTCIEIIVGDAFTNPGALIVPINNQLDVSLNGNVKKSNSIQSQLITKYYDHKDSHLKDDILKKVSQSSEYDIGTVVEIEQKNKKFYLLVNSIKKENNRVESNIDNFITSLNKMWDYLAHEASKESAITVPLVNTGNGRVSSLNRMIAVKQIINSFILTAKYKIICEKLIISIHPSDLDKGQINLDELNEFLRYSCQHYSEIRFADKIEGKEIAASEIISITG